MRTFEKSLEHIKNIETMINSFNQEKNPALAIRNLSFGIAITYLQFGDNIPTTTGRFGCNMQKIAPKIVSQKLLDKECLPYEESNISGIRKVLLPLKSVTQKTDFNRDILSDFEQSFIESVCNVLCYPDTTQKNKLVADCIETQICHKLS